MTDDNKLTTAVVCFALLMMALAIFLPSADAQSVPALSADIALGRTFVREAGTRASLRDDPAAIHAVISFKAEHIYRTGYLRAVMRATNRGPIRVDAPRPWIVELWPGADRPRPHALPGNLRWVGRHQRFVERTFAHARRVRRGEVEHQCRVPGATAGPDEYVTPHDWGNFYDAERYRRLNPTALDLDCGQTCTLNTDGSVRLDRQGNPKCNYFLHLPRYERRFGEG